MKSYFSKIKISTVVAFFACIVIAFLLWLYFNIKGSGAL